MTFGQHAVMFAATGGYVGYFPIGPGTMGSLVGLLFCLGIAALPTALGFSALVALVLLAAWVAGAAARIVGQKDPGCIVIDEIAGMAVALMGISLSLSAILAGLALFRLFDILKPFPISWLDKNIAGGWGIVLDDIAAGLMVNIVLRFAVWMLARIQ